MADVRHLHESPLLVDGEQDAVVAVDELAKPDAQALLFRGVRAATREPGEALYRLEDALDPTLGRQRRIRGDVLVDALNVRQCPWRQERPVEGTSLGIAA